MVDNAKLFGMLIRKEGDKRARLDCATHGHSRPTKRFSQQNQGASRRGRMNEHIQSSALDENAKGIECTQFSFAHCIYYIQTGHFISKQFLLWN